MAHNDRPGPLPDLQGAKSIPRMYSRFARRDPALYPLFGVMTVAVGTAAYFLLIRKPSQVNPMGTLNTKTAQQQQMDAMKKGDIPHIEMDDYKKGNVAAIQLPPEDNKKTVSLGAGVDPSINKR